MNIVENIRYLFQSYNSFLPEREISLRMKLNLKLDYKIKVWYSWENKFIESHFSSNLKKC